MLGLICIIAFSLLVKAIGQRSIAREAEGHPSLRACLVDAALLWATWVLLLTELLSLAYLLQFAAVLTAWIATCGVLIFLVRRGLGSGVGSDRSGKHSAEIHAKPLSFPLGLPRDALSIGIIAASLIFIAVAGIMAVFSPPNDPDTLSYHLSRQIYWLQQGSLDHFRTSNDRQIMMPPLAEIIGMHFMLLSGGIAGPTFLNGSPICWPGAAHRSSPGIWAPGDGDSCWQPFSCSPFLLSFIKHPTPRTILYSASSCWR